MSIRELKTSSNLISRGQVQLEIFLIFNTLKNQIDFWGQENPKSFLRSDNYLLRYSSTEQEINNGY